MIGTGKPADPAGGPETGRVVAAQTMRVGRETPGGTAQAAVPPALVETGGTGILRRAGRVFIACPRDELQNQLGANYCLAPRSQQGIECHPIVTASCAECIDSANFMRFFPNRWGASRTARC
jgi:hypothetical protein